VAKVRKIPARRSRATASSATRKSAEKRAVATHADPGARRPEVIVDFELDQGLLFVVLANFGTASARSVRVRFEPEFYGVQGEKCISSMRLFRALDLLAPGRRFRQIVDNLAAYFARREPAVIEVSITYRDSGGRRYEERLRHDLRIYRELGEVRPLARIPDPKVS
jgi:hypothetical protein